MLLDQKLALPFALALAASILAVAAPAMVGRHASLQERGHVAAMEAAPGPAASADPLAGPADPAGE